MSKMLTNQKMKNVAFALVFTLLFTLCPTMITNAVNDFKQTTVLAAASDTEEMQIRARWAEVKAAAVEVPFESILTEGEPLVTDGSVNYIPRLQTLMAEAHDAYVADGKLRVIKFPAGTFNFPVENPTASCVSGVGFRGAGKTANGDGTYSYLTRLTPTQTILGTNPNYASTESHNDVIIDCIEIDCSGQVIVPSISNAWYVYKAIFVQRVSNWWMNDIYAHDSLGTLFGLDYINGGVYHIDCYAKNSGRSASANASGPGAGFGITCGQFLNEPCKFVGCVAEGCKTGGYYLEIRSNKVDKPSGYSILGSKAFCCSFGIDDQGVDNLIVEDSEIYGNTAYGIRRGAVNTGDVSSGSSGGAGSKGIPGSMYIKRTKIYGNGSTGNPVVRSAGVSYSERCQMAGINDTCEQVFEDCEIYNNRGYGISNTYSVPRFIKLKGSTKIHNNGGSGIHFRRGVNPAETVSITTEGDNIEIDNNGICGDSTLLGTGGGTATGVYGDGITLSVNSDNNNMKFKAYGNKGRAVAFRPYMGKSNFTITGGVYSGDWNGQTNGRPYRNEIGATGNIISASMVAFNDAETYTNYSYNGNGNAAGASARKITSSTTGAVITQETDAANGDHFKMLFPAATSGTNRKLYTTLSANTPTGVVPMNTMAMSSALIKTNKDLVVSSSGNASFGSLIAEYKNNDPYCQMTIPAGVWTRIDMANSCIHTGSAPIFGFGFTDNSPLTDTEILVKNIMCLDKPDIVEYFDGATNSGTWVGSAYNSASTKIFGNPIDNLPPVVNAGSDLSISFPTHQLNLHGTATDDGKPSNQLTITWSRESGPGAVSFADATSMDTTATFGEAGTYLLKLTASDGALSTSDSVVITVRYPFTIQNINVTNQIVTAMTADITGTLSVKAKGIAAVYDQSGKLINLGISSNIIGPTQTGTQQFLFNDGIQLGEDEILKGFIWAVDENSVLTTIPLSQPFQYEQAPPPPPGTAFTPTADANTQDGSKASSNFGSNKEVAVKNDVVGSYRKGYFKFDLSTWTTPVHSAKLRIYGYTSSAATNVDCYAVTDDSWQESAISASNAPAMTSLIGSATVGTQQYYEIDVTSFVQSQMAGDKVISLGLDCATKGVLFHFNSKEATDSKPELFVN